MLTTIPLAGWTAHRHREAEQRTDEFVATVPQQTRAEYATSDRCEPCHPSQYHSWHRGYHRTMTQYASPETVRGDFDDVPLNRSGYDVHLSREGDDFMVEMVDPLWRYEIDAGQRPPPQPGETEPRVRRRIALVTGSHHMQVYWVPSNVGNGLLSLPFTWLLDERRWVPRSDVFLRPVETERHPLQVWNVSCIKCHATGGQPNALVGGKEIRTTVAEMGIACEACHGPAEAHVAANQNPLRRYWLHVRGASDPTIVNPARLAATPSSQVCGQCHSLNDASFEIELGAGKTYVPGDDLEKTMPLLRPLHMTPALEQKIAEDPLYPRNYFWADNTIRVSSRDYSGMIESKCMTSGKLSCGTCHSMHESDPVNLLAEGKEGDAPCVQCHPAIGGAIEAHTHHRGNSAGSRCYNCHMPYTVYGLMKGIRSHLIDSPIVTGRSGGSEHPNACNLCHVDRSLGWTAQALERWYHKPAVAGLTDTTPAAVDWLLSGDAVLRAIAAWHLGWEAARTAAPTTTAVPYLVAALADPYAAVRYVAGHSLKAIDPTSQFDYLASPAERQQAGDRILKRWIAQSPENEHALSAANARIKRLIEKRDDTAVQAME